MFTERTQVVPDDMYVIVRVSRLGTGKPTYAVYMDPLRSLYSGYLQCSDIHLRRNPASPV
jgi:hypothetical protein